jgi:hypothetical protein
MTLLSIVPADAKLVYQRAGTREIVTARDDGSQPHVIAHGVMPVISPNGRWVAFATPLRGDADLKLVRIDGGRSHLLMHHFPACACGPAIPTFKAVWSPDSRFIVGDDTSDGIPQLIDIERQTRRDLPFAYGGASFSPDVETIAAPVEDKRTRIELIAYDLKTRHRRHIGYGDAPAWGAGGVAFAAKAGLKVRHRFDRPARLLMPRASDQTYLYGVNWSSSGGRVLAAAGPSPFKLKAFLISPSSGRIVTLAPTFSEVEALSRDGRSVLGVTGGNVVRVGCHGHVHTLARHALSASWTK